MAKLTKERHGYAATRSAASLPDSELLEALLHVRPKLAGSPASRLIVARFRSTRDRGPLLPRLRDRSPALPSCAIECATGVSAGQICPTARPAVRAGCAC